MAIEEGPLVVEAIPDQPTPASQPAPAAAGSSANDLSDAAVREAIARAEAEGRNPVDLTISDLAQGSTPNPANVQPAAATVAKTSPAVPEKFLKTDGEVDVEKLQASTKALDEAIQNKSEKLQKTIDDYLEEYRAKEKQYREMPNPDKLAAQLPPAMPTQTEPVGLTDQQLRQKLAEDFQRDFVGTTADLIDVIVRKKLEERIKPIEEPIKHIENERKESRVRENIKKLAAEDPRVLDPKVFEAINVKLRSEPELWNLKNPHKSAWLEIKEELRLGEPPKGVQAQPSRAPSPILGGGTPPSTPSSSSQTDPRSVLANLHKLDLSDKKQEALGDAAIRSLFQGR